MLRRLALPILVVINEVDDLRSGTDEESYFADMILCHALKDKMFCHVGVVSPQSLSSKWYILNNQ